MHSHASHTARPVLLSRTQLKPRSYDEIVKGLTPFLKTCGYNPKKDLTFIPISALHGHNVRDRAASEVRVHPTPNSSTSACALARRIRSCMLFEQSGMCRLHRFWLFLGCNVPMLVRDDTSQLLPGPFCPVRLPARRALQICPWYDGPTLFETLDTVEVAQR